MINFEIIKNSLPSLFSGALVSLQIALFASLIGFIWGTILGIFQSINSRILNNFVSIYITIIRGTPMLIQIVFLYILLPYVGIHISKLAIAIIAIGINSSAYISQIVKSGIKAVPTGQLEAAFTLGISKFDSMRYIILPQALRVILPALSNELITLIKDSSLASIIGVTELYQQGNIIKSQTYDALTVYTAVAVCYLILTSSISFILHLIENYFNHARN